MPARPLITLADPLWVGHRETYFHEFTRSLHRVGADVIALCPSPERLDAPLEHPGAPALHTARIEEPHRTPWLDRLAQDPITTRRRWQDLTTALHKVEKTVGRRTDLVFLPWLDSYLRASIDERWSLGRLERPWSGLYFRPHHLTAVNGHRPGLLGRIAKGDRLLQSSSCVAVATLDETLRPALAKASGGKVIAFPDITNESPPDHSAPFARKIREKQAGRKVIGLIGMEPRKGVITMLKAADIAREQGRPWLFALGGISCLELYSPKERQFIEEHITQSRADAAGSNVLFQEDFKPIPDGPEFNGVMASFDVLFVAYHDFLGSSNVLTKASVLRKPVVCTALGCIAERTRNYDLGLAIPQGDAAACCDALDRLLRGFGCNNRKLQPRYADYHAAHCEEALDASMRQLIDLIPARFRSNPQLALR